MVIEDEFKLAKGQNLIAVKLTEGEPVPSVGSRLEVRGGSYEVVSVERFMKPLSERIPSNSIGIEVKEIL